MALVTSMCANSPPNLKVRLPIRYEALSRKSKYELSHQVGRCLENKFLCIWTITAVAPLGFFHLCAGHVHRLALGQRDAFLKLLPPYMARSVKPSFPSDPRVAAVAPEHRLR